MTEAEWLVSRNARKMLTPARMAEISSRKLRLFACAIARSIWSALDGPNRRLIARVEEGPASPPGPRTTAGWAAILRDPVNIQPVISRSWRAGQGKGHGLTEAQLAKLVREVVGNPFRPIDPALVASWRAALPPTARALAQEAYDNRDWALLPLLADALQDTGCTDQATLDHLRSPGPHVRGCWALDLILAE